MAIAVIDRIFWWTPRHRAKSRQRLASLLMLDIADGLEALDLKGVLSALDHALYDSNGTLALREIVLPRFVNYEANVANLPVLGAPLSHQVVNLFERWKKFAKSIAEIKVTWSDKGYGHDSAAHRLLEEAVRSQQLADKVLAALRPIAFAHSVDGLRRRHHD